MLIKNSKTHYLNLQLIKHLVLQNRMKNVDGGYFSAIDADNNEGEGHYYIFNKDEILNVAGDNLELLLDFYQIDIDNPSIESNIT